MARDQAVGLEAGDDARERALAQVDGLGQVLHRRSPLARREPLQHLELADAQPVLVLSARSSAKSPRVTVEQVVPRVDQLLVFVGTHGAPHCTRRLQYVQ